MLRPDISRVALHPEGHQVEFAMRYLTRLVIFASACLLVSQAWSAPSPAGYVPLGPAPYFPPDAPNGALLGRVGGFDELDPGSYSFRSGLVHLNNAVAFERKRDAETNARARERMGQRSKDEYVRARKAFQYAIKGGYDNVSYVPGAWTNVAYIEGKLGNHETALAAADRALELAPGLAAARENRGEALLGLNRIADAKAQYLDLYPGQPALSAILLSAMKQWVQDQRASGTADQATVDELDRWIRNREQIAH